MNKQLFDEMKKFFNVTSLEDVAEKLGYSRKTARTWRTTGLTKNVLAKFEKAKADKKKDDESHKYAEKADEIDEGVGGVPQGHAQGRHGEGDQEGLQQQVDAAKDFFGSR